jgi:nicotinate phosphoribosyltransferase
MAIITSLLDSDLYKFTMQQAVFKYFSDVNVKYKFVCRNKDVDLRPYDDEISREISALKEVKLTQEEREYLAKLPYFTEEYLDALMRFRFFPYENIGMTIYKKNELELNIAGNWFQTILYEVPILAIINEVYCRHNMPQDWITRGKTHLNNIVTNRYSNKKYSITEFGTRRRISKAWQYEVFNVLYSNDVISSTSNVELSMLNNINPTGTMAHEWIQAGQGLAPTLVKSQQFMLETWNELYKGDLNCALTDTIGIDFFLKGYFNWMQEIFPTLRHDSGCPFKFVDKVIKHCDKSYANPKVEQKYYPTIIFSDNLTMLKVEELQKYCDAKGIECKFGMGTHLVNCLGSSNDDYKPLQCVIKMIECNGKPVAKLSDEKNKNIGDVEHIKRLKKECGVK